MNQVRFTLQILHTATVYNIIRRWCPNAKIELCIGPQTSSRLTVGDPGSERVSFLASRLYISSPLTFKPLHLCQQRNVGRCIMGSLVLPLHEQTDKPPDERFVSLWCPLTTQENSWKPLCREVIIAWQIASHTRTNSTSANNVGRCTLGSLTLWLVTRWCSAPDEAT